ncbi:phosphoribosylanthranilate isomerase [Noviherbaspirillum denitrificans]|uniref:N-(5'-phosphoribosyl)anthranilate isomerase n=1 Tax=Noviherbaspirillum denitrificans TaxID=1968433 RepID=A0A254T9W6_9BURK|nr:phosphoribosylanthranilate isomerase [Noviherbaspirillum denitrificans]OWW18967.1 N-(5'-phosphoribosyl)anthranilate isomerase [Noviherbaspirillum denitrificans]
MTARTRIKICGLTRREDLDIAVTAGADAIGLVFYPKSPRYIDAPRAAQLITVLPPFVTTVGLFVNATAEEVRSIVEQVPVSLLQFHGDETAEQCAAIAQAVHRPFMRAVRMGSEMTGEDLLKYEQQYRAASSLFAGLLLDAFVEGYGGGGKVFDWSLIPKELAPRVVLSGGLSVQNATEAVLQVRPYAVDISSGVEQSKGIKDPAKIRDFIAAVRKADTIPGN